MTTYHYTLTSNFHYDATLTQELLYDWISDQRDSSGRDTHQYFLNWGSRAWGGPNLYHWPSDSERHTPNPDVTPGESEEETPSVTYEYYENFTAIAGVDFTVASGLTDAWGRSLVPSYWALGDNTSMTNVTFGNATVDAVGSGAKLNDITFKENGGSVCLGGTSSREEEYVVSHTDMGDVVDTHIVNYTIGGQTLNTMSAAQDFDTLVVLGGASATVNNVTVERNMRNLFIAGGSDYTNYYNVNSRLNGSGTTVTSVTVHGALSSAYVGNGAVLDGLIVGNWRQWGADSHASAFIGENIWGATSHMSAINMTVASGGTANNIYLGFGGSVTVLGPQDRVSSRWVDDSNGGHYEVTTAYASGTGGVLTNLQMATSGGLMLDGANEATSRALWSEPYNYGYHNSDYVSGFIAGAPQSAYVQFDSNTSGRNIQIGNGGSMQINSGASVTGISMGGLTTSLLVTNSSGGRDVWIGDRGAQLTINGGFASDVTLDPVMQSFDYYSATHDYLWLYSSSLEAAYYSSHGSYGSGAAHSSAIYNSAVSGYREYMSGMYNSGTVYTNLGDDEPYGRMYVGGVVTVNGGRLYNVSGFSYLQVTGEVEVTVSDNVSSWSVHQWTDGNVSKASGAMSATMEVVGGAHVSSATIAGGRVIMTAAGSANARWIGRENKQSNYNLVEHLDLRTSGLLGSNNSAIIIFDGGDSGGWSQPVTSGGVSGYIDYRYAAMDPGEIHFVSVNSGLVVSASGGGSQDFTYTGKGEVVINGLGTVVLSGNLERNLSDSWAGKGPYLGSAYDIYYFGVVKGVYDEEDGTLLYYTILDGNNGGFDWTGTLLVGSGGIVQNIGSDAGLMTGNNISSTTWNPVVDNDASKRLFVVAGGSAENVTVTAAVSNYEIISSSLYQTRAGLIVSSGGTATNVTILNGGVAMAIGGTIDNVFVGNGGILYLSGWAGAHQVMQEDGTLAGPQYLDTTVLNGVRLDSGGRLAATYDWGYSGKAPNIIANAGGGVLNGVTANGVAYVSGLDYAGTITLTNGQRAEDLTVRGHTVSEITASGTTRWTTTLASLNVSSGGTATGTTIAEDGVLYASNGAIVNATTIASGGRLVFEAEDRSVWEYVSGNASANGITIKGGGNLSMNSRFALTATNVAIQASAGLSWSIVKDEDEDYARQELSGTWTADWGNGTFHTQDGVVSGFGGEFGYQYTGLDGSSIYTSNGLELIVANGGVLLDANVHGVGAIRAFNGGQILGGHFQGIALNSYRGLRINIGSGGYASGITTTISSGGICYNMQMTVNGSGAVADATVISGGYLGVGYGGVLNGVTLLAPEWYEPTRTDDHAPTELEIMEGGTANNVVASAGLIAMYAESGKGGGGGVATLSNADVHSGVTIEVYGNGTVMDGTLNLGGTINTSLRHEVWDDTAQQWVYEDSSTVVATTLTVNFDLTEHQGNEEVVMIDNLANLQGATLGTITVSVDQDSGNYVLAMGADEFTGSLTVIMGTETIGTISVGGYIQVSDELTFRLTNSAENGLVFSVLTTDAAIEDIIATVGEERLKKDRWTNQAVNIKVNVNQYAKSIWYRIRKAVGTRGEGDEGEWIEFDNEEGITISEYCEIEFMALDEHGNQSKIVTYTVNYDDTPATVTDLQFNKIGKTYLDSGDSCWVGFSVQDDMDEAPIVELSTDGETWTRLVGWDDYHEFEVTDNGQYLVRVTDHAGNVSITPIIIDFYNMPAITHADADGIAWEGRDDTPVIVTLKDETVGTVEFEMLENENSISFYNLPVGEYAAQVAYVDGEETEAHQATFTQNSAYVPDVRQAVDDDVVDVFFAQSIGVWDEQIEAKAVHTGILGGWTGTGDTVELTGKNRLADVFIGGTDASVLLLTDDPNGDSLFLDDLYTALPNVLDAQQARIAQIKFIYAGAGDDVVDLTSQRFAYEGDGIVVNGGDGNDVIWANQGDNWLFGDRGNDSIIGASGNDVIVGGAGDDILHGGGGNDIFAFGGNWGHDTVYQLEDGEVTLWFKEGDASNAVWDEESSTLTYTDGDNSVTVTGVALENINLLFGAEGGEFYDTLLSMGAFDEFTNESIFEDRNRGMLA